MLGIFISILDFNNPTKKNPSQTCIKRSSLRQRKNGILRQVTS